MTSKQGLAQEAILKMIGEGVVPTPERINAAIGQPWRTNHINGRLTKFRTKAMLDAGFFRIVNDVSFVARWMPPGSSVPEGWHRE